MIRRLFVLAFIAAMATACAYSPQQITINPTVTTDAERYGNGRPVLVSVEDVRATQELGSRGGIYEETSLITIGNSLTGAISRAAEASLAAQGFSVNGAQQGAASLKILVDELSYDVPEQSVGKKVLLRAVLRVEAAMQRSSGDVESYTGRYQTKTERQTVVTPSMSSNEEMINSLLSDTLVRLFEDPKLKAFLSNI